MDSTAFGTAPANAVPTSFAINGSACGVATTPSFTIASSASSLSIAQGKSATDTITVTDVNGFAGNVTLAASGLNGLPGGVTAAFTPNPATGTSVLTLTAGSSAVAGSYTINITGTSGSLTSSASVGLTVNTAGSFTLRAFAGHFANSSRQHSYRHHCNNRREPVQRHCVAYRIRIAERSNCRVQY